MSRNVKVVTEISVHLSAEELANIFMAMAAEEQVHVFSTIGSSDGFALQMGNTFRHPLLNKDGRWFASVVGEYSIVD